MIRVRRGRRDPRAVRAALVDAFLENLALLVLAVIRELVGVLRRVELAERGVDADLAEHAFHAERSRLVGHDRHDARADALVAHERRQNSDERHRRRELAIAAALELALEELELRHLQRLGFRPARRQEAAELRAALLQIPHLLAVVGGLVVLQRGEILVGDRHVEAIAEDLQVVVVELLLLMRDVLAFAGLAHAEAFDGLRENDGRPALVIHGRVVRRIDLDGIVAAAIQMPDVLVRQVRDHRLELGIAAEEMLARIRAAFGLERLVLAVDALLHRLAQQAVLIAREQRIPARAPDDLDDVPARRPDTPLRALE